MDFVSYIRDQSTRLHSRDYVDVIWDEIEGHQSDEEAAASSITEYTNHLPVLLEQFWELASEKLNEGPIDEIEPDLKVYLLVLIYQCTTQSQDSMSQSTVMYASEVYVHLLTTELSEDFFKTKLYRGVLTTLQGAIEAASSDFLCLKLMHKLRRFLSKSKLLSEDLEITMAAFVQIILMKTRSIFEQFDLENEADSIAHEAFLSLKTLICNENVPSRRTTLITFLFNGLRRCTSTHLTPHYFNMVQTGFRNLLKNLHFKFREDGYKTFINAFVHVWKHPDFIYYGEATLIMNNLKEKYYRSVMEVFNKLAMSTATHKNLLKLSLSIVCNPSKHSSLEKVQVTNEIIIRNLLLNCLSSKSEISNAAIESIGELLLSPDLGKTYVMTPAKKVFNCEAPNFLTVPTILQGLQTLMNKKWSSRSRNKPLFGIVISIMLLSEKDYPEVYQEVLGLLSEEASPFDLKQFLQVMSKLYLQLHERKHERSSMVVLKILFKMALHPMASSTEFVKHLYTNMVYPTVFKGAPVPGDVFIEPIITDNFNFKEFFQKCHTLGLIRKEHVVRLIGNVPTMNKSNLKLLCAIVHHTDYKDLSVIADYINDHFMTVCNEPNLHYLLDIYGKILKNNAIQTQQEQSRRWNEIMTCFIKHHLLKQTFRWDAVANAFSLLKGLENFTNLAEDFECLRQEYDKKLADALRTRGSFLSIYYYSRLVLFGKVIPSAANIDVVVKFLQDCPNQTQADSLTYGPKLWIGCLLLYTNIAIVQPTFVESALDALHQGLNAHIAPVCLASVNMAFDLCNMVTHNFEDLIKFMFRQLVVGDAVFKRTCLVKIDRLIRDDYLKVDLQQYLVFVCLLGNKAFGLGDYLHELLSENFYMVNSPLIAKNFVPLIVHVNGYRKHPLYKLNNVDYASVEVVAKNVSDRRKIYTLLLHSLPVKFRFNIVHAIAVNILDKTIKGEVKFDNGYWNMITDSIFIFKLMSISIEDESVEEYYKKVFAKINKYLLNNAEFSENQPNREHQKEIVQSSLVLQNLLFFNDSDNIQRHIRILLFDAIMHWTDYLLADLVHIVHVDRNKEIQNFYTKIGPFYKKNAASLNIQEESFETLCT